MDRTARVELSFRGTWQLGEHRLLPALPPHGRYDLEYPKHMAKA